jgi:hypothetical protein
MAQSKIPLTEMFIRECPTAQFCVLCNWMMTTVAENLGRPVPPKLTLETFDNLVIHVPDEVEGLRDRLIAYLTGLAEAGGVDDTEDQRLAEACLSICERC